MPSKPLTVTASLLAAAALVAAGSGPTEAAAASVVGVRAVVAAPRTAETVFAGMSEAQRVGQLLMVGTPATGARSAARSQIARYHVGNLMLTGRSYSGTRTPAKVASAAQARATTAATSRVRLFVATDQEGGLVQVLHGSGISTMPSALTQGTWSAAHVRSSATRWARQLRASGVNMNLGPVLDTVPSAAFARRNPPIGAKKREFGYRTSNVAAKGTAFAMGMAAGKVVASIKHFPGLGRVTKDTDTHSGVTDRITARKGAYLKPFRTAIKAGVPFVMMSTAYYSRMDRANLAAFSPFIINTVLRKDLGFAGPVISDDLANAKQVSRWSAGERAVKFVNAGGDIVLTVNPATLPAMYNAVLNKARADKVFRAKVDKAALLVLKTKESNGLLGK